jgi:DNA-binding response OmpR family regulator
MPENPHILIADDDQFFGVLLSAKLKEANYDVSVALDGGEAMKMIRMKLPDILILDLVLPIKDGFDIIMEAKADDTLKKMKILVLTNLAQKEDRERALAMGVGDFLVKSNVSIIEVVEKIKEMLK